MRARTSLQLASAWLAAGHRLEAVYFYQAGARYGLKTPVISSDDFDPVAGWLALADQQSLPLSICIGSAERRGVVASTVAPGFSITGLGTWLAAAAAADRVLRLP